MSVPLYYDQSSHNSANHSQIILSPPCGGLGEDRFEHSRLGQHSASYSSPSDINIDSPSVASISGSSAQMSDDDFATYPKDPDSYPTETQNHPFSNYRSLLDAPPVYSIGTQIGYGEQRFLYIERLIWNCVARVYSIWGAPTRREPGLTASIPLQTLVHQGLVHGLCNEIVILPVMENIQNAQTGCHSADLIPFPLFMAEMLRRMRASCFLLSITMRYILDIAYQAKLAKERAQCGWCRSGVDGCNHSIPRDTGSASRFSKGRSAASKNSSANSSANIPNSVFTKGDALAPLADPRKAFLGSLILANKFHRDRSVGNKSWATLIGLPLEEVHSAERAVGEALGWTLSRPWLTEGAHGVATPGPVHPSFSEPLFATNDAEVARYGVKSLREAGQIPPPQSSASIFGSFGTNILGDEGVLQHQIDIETLLSGPKLPSLLSSVPGSVLPIRKGSAQFALDADAARKIAPIPNKSILPIIKTNPLRKASTAPGVLQLSAMDIEIVHDTSRGDRTPELKYHSSTPVPNQIPFPCSVSSPNFPSLPPASSWELSPQTGKRKASQELGRKVVARCGDNGQRILVGSPSDSDLATPQLSNASSSPGDSKTPRIVHPLAPPLWNNSDGLEDIDIPELDSEDIDCDKTPLVGQFTRSSTQSDLMDITGMSIDPSGQHLWAQSGRSMLLPNWAVGSPNQMSLASKMDHIGTGALLPISC